MDHLVETIAQDQIWGVFVGISLLVMGGGLRFLSGRAGDFVWRRLPRRPEKG